jgi:hypothetical protein
MPKRSQRRRDAGVSPHAATREAGLSVLEILVAVAVLMVVAFQLSDGLSTNVEARGKIERQQQFLSIDTALRGGVFKVVGDLLEGPFDCSRPRKAFTRAWSRQPLRGVRFRLLPAKGLDARRLPPAMVRRCTDPTWAARVSEGLYFCLELQPGASGEAKGFLTKYDAFAEVFFGLWDAERDAATTCSLFDDARTPVRGARMLYTLYWRPKAPGARAKDPSFSVHTGEFYGQTKR